MEYYIDLENGGYTEEEVADIRQCLETLFAVAAGTQPMDREFGLNLDGILDAPMSVAKNELALEIIEKTERYEPRVSIDSVEFKTSTDGALVPYIYITKPEE